MIVHSNVRVLLGFLVLLPCYGFTAQPFSQPRACTASSGRSLAMRRDEAAPERRSVILTGLSWVTAVAVGLPLLAPEGAQAKYTNIEAAREAGERKMEEIEKEKGPLIILPGGVRYREELTGKGQGFDKGDIVKIRYEVQKGNGDFMFSRGYGREFLQDVGETYDFVYGGENTVPKAAEQGMAGMKVGGKRKILMPPSLGFSTSGGMPAPETFSGKRKLLNHQNENLIFEVELIRIRKKTGGGQQAPPAEAPTS